VPVGTQIDPQVFLTAFHREQPFSRVDKTQIASFLESGEDHTKFQIELDKLNKKLEQYDLHFGYRVFDEIIAFLNAADENKFFGEGLKGLEYAFDSAVLMKVLPKFHGSRSKLEEPLKELLAWCQENPSPVIEVKRETLFEEVNFRYPKSAHKVWRMIRSLQDTGFASFS
jgi:5-methylcytosine-specific restriction enzyme B